MSFLKVCHCSSLYSGPYYFSATEAKMSNLSTWLLIGSWSSKSEAEVLCHQKQGKHITFALVNIETSVHNVWLCRLWHYLINHGFQVGSLLSSCLICKIRNSLDQMNKSLFWIMATENHGPSNDFKMWASSLQRSKMPWRNRRTDPLEEKPCYNTKKYYYYAFSCPSSKGPLPLSIDSITAS